MTILHFSDHQNDVFVTALLPLVLATVLAVLPVVFAPTLRRSKRLVPVVAVAAVLGAACVSVAAWQAGAGFRTLQDERAAVGAQLRDRYRLAVDAGQVGELIDGGVPVVDGAKVRLVPQQPDGDVYDVRVAGEVVQPAS